MANDQRNTQQSGMQNSNRQQDGNSRRGDAMNTTDNSRGVRDNRSNQTEPERVPEAGVRDDAR